MKMFSSFQMLKLKKQFEKPTFLKGKQLRISKQSLFCMNVQKIYSMFLEVNHPLTLSLALF